MITRLSAKYEVVCDRCGKSEICDDYQMLVMGYEEIKVSDMNRVVKSGSVCKECYKEFVEFTENFFDEVNHDA